MLGHYRTLLEGIVADPARTVSDLPLIGAAERRLLLEDWNATDFAYASGLTMHGCFEAQAARQPEAPAVWHAGAVLSYAELNRRANRLALELQARGAGPGTLIGVCMERHPDMLTGLIAILKSGGAYVPLDPNYPAERVAFMLDDGIAPILLTQAELAAELPATDARGFASTPSTGATQPSRWPTRLSRCRPMTSPT